MLTFALQSSASLVNAPTLWHDRDAEVASASNNGINLAPMKTWQKMEDSSKLFCTPVYTEEKSPYEPAPAKDELLFPHMSKERLSSPEDNDDDGNGSLCSEDKLQPSLPPAETLSGKCLHLS